MEISTSNYEYKNKNKTPTVFRHKRDEWLVGIRGKWLGA